MANRVDTDQPGHQRRYPRYALKLEVTPTSEHNFFTGFTENISEGGVFIATYDQVPLGTRLRFSFTLPDSPEPIEALGEVRWSRAYGSQGDSISPGIGLNFVEITPAQLARVQKFLESREAIFYDD